jgi:hypothetical protein
MSSFPKGKAVVQNMPIEEEQKERVNPELAPQSQKPDREGGALIML